MSIINLKDKTINAKIVYYGTALGGKTTSLKHVHRVIDPEQKVELVSLNTESDRTLFFDFLPITLGVIGGFTIRLQGFTVPGQVRYNLTRKYVLTGADAVVFVADSQRSQLENNRAALANLEENLAANGMDYQTIPLVLQYNKQDLPDLVPTDDLNGYLNERGVPAFCSSATEGQGVFETFMEVSKAMIAHISGQYRMKVDRASIADALEVNLARYLRQSGPVERDPGPEAAGFPESTSPEEPAEDRSKGRVRIAGTEEGRVSESEELLRRAVDSNIEIAQLYSEVNEVKNRLSERVRELTALNELGKTLAAELNVDRLLDAVLESAVTCLGTTHGSLLLAEAEGRPLVEHAVKGFDRDPLASAMIDSDGASRLFDLAMRGDGLLVTDEEQRTLLSYVRRTEPTIRSLMVSLLVSRDEVLGVLAVYFLGEAGGATREKQRFLSALAGQAGVALENARLMRRIEGFNRELEQTVKRRTAELRKAYDDLRELDRLKDDFLSSMSHELLTPLTSIQSFSEILMSMEAEELQTSLGEFLNIINQESLRLTRRLQQLLDLSQIEAGKITFRSDEVNLRRLAERVHQERSEGFAMKGIRTGFRCPARPVTTVGDEKWIARALGNLLDNALEFTEEGGSVVLELGVDEGFAFLAVEDSGVGIPPEFQTAIFQRFKQLGEVLTDKPKGIGLGLPLAREVVVRQGGRILVESHPDRGSRFTIALPLPRRARTSSQRRTCDHFPA